MIRDFTNRVGLQPEQYAAAPAINSANQKSDLLSYPPAILSNNSINKFNERCVLCAVNNKILSHQVWKNNNYFIYILLKFLIYSMPLFIK